MDIDGDADGNAMDVDSTPLPGSRRASKHGTTQGLTIPLPGPIVDGKRQKRFMCIDGPGVKKPMLVEWCKRFRLPHSGNMASLREKLVWYSEHEEEWNKTIPAARRAHLGGSSRTTLKKKSVRRTEAMFGQGSTVARAPNADVLPTENLQPKQTQEERDRILTWARTIVKENPYRPREERRRMAAQRALLERSTNTDPALQATLEYTSCQLNQLLSHIVDPANNRTTALSPLSLLTTLPAHSSMDPAPSEHGVAPVFTMHTTASLSNAAVHLPVQVNDTVPSVDAVITRTLVLGDMTRITFTAADVKAPPIISFAHDIAGLNRMWDDTSSNWDNVSPLVICGCPIALVYWRNVYKSSRGKNEHWKPGQWRGTKDKWFKWRIMVHRYRQGTPESFWEEFTRDGERMNFTRIIAELAQQRVAADNALSRQARDEYGTTFPAFFSYRKGGVTHAMVRSSHVAKRYRQLKGIAGEGLESDDEDE